MMKTLVQKVFGNTIDSEAVLNAFPNSKVQLQQASKELQKKLEQKRAAEMSDDEKIAMAIAALRAKARSAQANKRA